MDEDNYYSGGWWLYESKEGNLLVMPVCPECHKFIKMGRVLMSDSAMKFEGFICKTHGEIEPEIFWQGDLED